MEPPEIEEEVEHDLLCLERFTLSRTALSISITVDFSPLSSLNPVNAMITFILGPDGNLLGFSEAAPGTFLAGSRTRASLSEEVVKGRAAF